MSRNDDLISRQAAIDAVNELRKSPWFNNPQNVYRTEAVDIVERLCIKELPSVQPDQKWIPVTELPDTDRNVFIARGHEGFMTACIGHYDHSNKMWYEDRNWFANLLYDAVYWCEMPSLPEPYKGE